MELEFSFIDKNEHLKKQFAANFDCANHENLEEFHDRLRACMTYLQRNFMQLKISLTAA